MDKPSYLEISTANELLVKLQMQVLPAARKATADRAHAATRQAARQAARETGWKAGWKAGWAWFLLALMVCVGLAALAATIIYYIVH